MVDRTRFGERRTCPACGCKFYDMHRDPPTCPRCGVDVSQLPKEAEEPAAELADIDEEPEELPEELCKETFEVEPDEDAGKDDDSEDT